MIELPIRLLVYSNIFQTLKKMYRFTRRQLTCCQHMLRKAELMDGMPVFRPVLAHHYATDPNRRPGFFESFVANLKKEYSESKDMKDSLHKFREEAKKLEESEALKEARRKFHTIEGESSKSKSAFRKMTMSIFVRSFFYVYNYLFVD